MGNIVINGHNVVGRNIVVRNNVVTVDGKTINIEESKVINITVNGDLEKLDVDACDTVSISGNVTGDVGTVSGDIKCGDIGGSAKTVSGDIKAKTINGKCSTVSGDITTN